MNRIRMTRYLLTALLASLGWWTLTSAETIPGTGETVTNVDLKSEGEKPETAEVTVNGQQIPPNVGGDGQEVVLPDGTRVESEGGSTTIIHGNGGVKTTVSGSGNINVSVDSNSGKTASGVVHAFSHEYSTTGGSVSQQSTVYSDSQSTIQINQ